MILRILAPRSSIGLLMSFSVIASCPVIQMEWTPNDIMLIIVFGLKGPEFSGNFHIVIPYLMMEPIKEELSPKYLREKDMGNTWAPQLKELLKDTLVTVIAELGKTTQTVRDLLNLQVEDVIKLKAGPDDPISISIDQVPKYQGYPGIIKGNRAVEIVKLLNTNGGKN